MKKVNKPGVKKSTSESEVKNTIISAKQLYDSKNNLGNISTGLMNPMKSPNMLANQRNAEQLLTSFLTKSGFEFDKFDMIRVQNQTELKQIAEKEKANAIKNSTSIKDDFVKNIANWRNSLENIVKVGPANPNFNFIVIGTPFLVWPSHGVIMDDPHIEPWKNSVKFKINSNSSSYGSENVTFYFLWENPDNKYVVLNVGSSLVLNGYCENSADGGWAGIFPGGTSNLNLDAKLILYDWTTQPPTAPYPPESTQNKHILTLTAYGGGYFEAVGAIEHTPATGSYDIGYNLFLIPPHGVAVFEVVLSVQYQNDNARIDVIDFESGDFQVICPAVVIAVLS